MSSSLPLARNPPLSMLLLIVQIGEETFGIDARDIVEVTPYLEARPIPQAPPYVVGLMGYRGSLLPLIDLRLLLTGCPCVRLLSTRVVVASFTRPDGEQITLGLLGERITETATIDASQLTATGISLPGAHYLGKIVLQEGRLVQLLVLAKILPSELQEMLSQEARPL